MTGTALSSADLTVRKRRILFRAWHRGTREMDLLLGRFVDSRLPEMDEAELTEMEALIELPDHDLFLWVTGEAAIPADFDTPLVRAFCNRQDTDGRDG